MPNPRSLRTLSISSNVNKQQNLGHGPPSPTFSDATNASAINFGSNGPEKVITRADLKAGLQAYDELLNACANYRSVLMSLSKATSQFADAMEACSRLKGPSYETSTRIQGASGLHHLMGNQWHIMADSLDRKFEKPLKHHLDGYKSVVSDRSSTYERALKEKSRIIRQTELSNLNKRTRNLQSFREALQVLQRQVDDLDELKARHYEEIMEHEEEVWDFVQGKLCLVVRSSLDIFDRFTAKASDPVIEPMLQAVPDPFDSYGPPATEDQIFSILPPLMTTTSPGPTSIVSTPQLSASDLGISPTRPTWMPTVSQTGGGYFTETNSAWADLPGTLPIASPPNSPPHRRSQSPQQNEGGAFGVFRRNSHPPTSGGGTKAESKLRSVLTAIDESHARSNNSSNGSEKGADSPDTPTNPEISAGINGLTRSASDTLGQPFSGGCGRVGSWSHDSLDSGDESEHETSPVTPRRSTAFLPTSDDPLPPTLRGHDREASRTPMAESVELPT
ncbi:hypothetical protein BJ322DRAFT_1111156 [Thelephora terrestris]|uniref:IMD domain-containing protein n=1 Tax=Thelephora terrestris TaxID=56493 RepID=A0A9P6H9M6_9AGAM|nr:hypothetical protein BJ322DRAFT_1111156 [Thelephora terrestris]